MGALSARDHVGKNGRDCMITLIPFGFCVLGMSIGSNALFPVCYQLWAQGMFLGIMYMTAGSISISAANGRRKSNYLSRISVSMMLHVLCWLETFHVIAIVINVMTKSFFKDETLPVTQCPYSGANGRDENLYYIMGGVNLGLIVICLILSALSFTAFWKSPEWFEHADTELDIYRGGVQLNPTRDPPRRENIYLAPAIGGGGDVARAVWPTPPTTPGYATTNYKRDLSAEPDYTSTPYNSSGQPGGGKSLRIVSMDRQIRKTCVVGSMRELILVAKEKLRFNGDESLGICFDSTGEDIEDEAAFQAVPEFARLMIMSKTLNEHWEPPKQPYIVGYENEGFARDPPHYTPTSARRALYKL